MLLRQPRAAKGKNLTQDPPGLFRKPPLDTAFKAGCGANERESRMVTCWHKETLQNVFKEKDGGWGLSDAERNFMEELSKEFTCSDSPQMCQWTLFTWGSGAPESFPGCEADRKGPRYMELESQIIIRIPEEEDRMKQKLNWKR